MIVGARLTGQVRQALRIGWHAAAFTRAAKLEKLDKYLEPAPPPAKKRKQGALAVLARIDRFSMKQEQGDGLH